MRAIVHDGYGPPEDHELREIEKPRLDDKGVLVRVRVASVNALDWHLMRGEPSFLRLIAGTNPKGRIPGVDVAGRVDAVGRSVTHFRPGDEVFGSCRGSFAEFALARETLVPKPPGLTFEQAAAIPVAGCATLQALRDHGRLRAGQSVLVNGAAGGVGTFTVQIAKTLGADVTGVCSTGNLELVRAIGADHVIDYTAEDFTRGDRRYDLIVQAAGNRTAAEQRRALAPRGRLIVVGGGTGREPGGSGLLALFSLMVTGRLLAPFVRQRELMFMSKIRQADLIRLAQLVEGRRITPVVDRVYPLAAAAEAIRHVETGHARGKILVMIQARTARETPPVPGHRSEPPAG